MPDIENDMDDLFRRAAEKYPLRPGKSNWDVIDKKMSQASTGEARKTKTKNNYKKTLFLLLIGFSLFMGFMILNNNAKNYSSKKIADQPKSKSVLENDAVTKNDINIKKLNGALPKINRVKLSTSSQNLKEENSSPQKNYTQTRSIDKNENEFAKNGLSQSHTDSFSKNNYTTNQTNVEPEIKDSQKYAEPEKSNLPAGSKNENLPSNKKDLVNKDSFADEKKKAKSNSKILKERKFYAGVIAGADFSKVKSGPFKGPGFSAGIMVGYKINNSFFVETGILRDNKYYFSEGKTFYEEGVSMPQGMIIKNLESKSEILEIPLKAGYNFYKKKNTNLFISGGIATYIMTREKNNYNVTMNGNPEKMEGIYKKNNIKIPAVINISGGWEYQSQGKLKIRLAPYLNLPIQGIGVGKLPVTSAGIQIGLVQRIK